MAARTLTYTALMAREPKSVHIGVNSIAWNFNSGATAFGTLSDVVLLGKIPNGALITSKTVRFGAQGNAHFGLVLLATEANGTLSVHATLVASMTASQTAAAVFEDHIPYKLSLSDDRAVQHAILALNCSTGASETVSFSLQGHLEYLTDGSPL